MHFDLTPDITLTESQKKAYLWLRISLYTLALVAFFYLAFALAFPTRIFSFSFLNPNSSKNTITDLRDFRGDFINMGNFKSGEDNYFYASFPGSFSRAEVEFSLNKRLNFSNLGAISVRKGYKAFFYPEGEVLGFKEGSLLKNKEKYFIISQGKIREFENLKLVESLGFDPHNFWEVSSEELSVNPQGERIALKDGYPDGTLFQIQDNFYLKKDSQLQKFSSQAAFLSQYPLPWSIAKDASFLNSNIINNNLIGFADGSLISYGDAVSIVNGQNIYPIDNFTTFEILGYVWDDLIPAGSDEVSLYERQKLVNLTSPHPAGTVFYAANTDKYYLIQDGQKRLLPSKKIADSWLKKSPILVDGQSLEIQGSCTLNKKSWSFKSYLCSSDISALQNLKGKDYEFKFASEENFRTNDLTIRLKKEYSWNNLNKNLREIFSRVKKNYVSQNNAQ